MIKNEKAFAMIFTLALLAVVPVMALTLANYSLNSFQIARSTNNKTKAYYIARSGAEAAISAWKEADIDNGSLETVIFDDQDNFVLKSEYQDNSSQYGEMIAEIDVDFEKEPYDPENNQYEYTIFTAHAKMLNSAGEETVRAKVSPYLNVDTEAEADELGWYDYNSGEIIPGDNTQTGNISSDFWSWVLNLLDEEDVEREVNIKYHDRIYGTVEINTDGSDMELENNNNKNKVVYTANTVYFNDELNLFKYSIRDREWTIDNEYKGVLITLGENLVFNEKITIGHSANDYGALILGLPDGLGFKLDNHDGIYGKVYFKERVNAKILKFWLIIPYLDNVEIIEPNSSYYFKRITDTNEEGETVPVGIDLLRWKENGYDEDVLIPIPKNDPSYSPPDPEEEYIINWF